MDWLQKQGIQVEYRNIKTEHPTQKELDGWQTTSGLQLSKFFNTSGQIYRQMELSKKLPGMTREEQLGVLAGDGMLVKRPLLVGEDFVLVGFKEKEWEEKLGNKSF